MKNLTESELEIVSGGQTDLCIELVDGKYKAYSHGDPHPFEMGYICNGYGGHWAPIC
jgi:hypothetical protein